MKLNFNEDIVIPSELGIDPYIYLDIKFKFEFYIKLIDLFGGYMFSEHIYKFSKKSKRQTFRDIHLMEESLLLKIILLNNNSYVVLTKISLRYLRNRAKVSQLALPTSTQLKTSCYLAQYLKNPEEFFNSSKPYSDFLNRYKNEIENYKRNDGSADISFLNNFREKVKIVKEEEIKSKEKKDVFSNLSSSKIFFNSIENEVVDLILLDFDRTKPWIYKTLIQKIEPIFKTMGIYKAYNVKILTSSHGREKRLKKDMNNMQRSGLIFLRNIQIENLNILKYFFSTKQKESFLKDIDKYEMSQLKKKLKENH